MTDVAKYNICKGVSTALTVVTPIATLACCGEFFVHRSDTAMSAAGLFTIVLLLFIFRDKIAEKWKTPSAFILCTAVLVLILLVEKIIMPMKAVCIATMISTAVDEVSCKRLYKQYEQLLPFQANNYKWLGFILATQAKIEGDTNG